MMEATEGRLGSVAPPMNGPGTAGVPTMGSPGSIAAVHALRVCIIGRLPQGRPGQVSMVSGAAPAQGRPPCSMSAVTDRVVLVGWVPAVPAGVRRVAAQAAACDTGSADRRGSR
jgi:hypothetical protein